MRVGEWRWIFFLGGFLFIVVSQAAALGGAALANRGLLGLLKETFAEEVDPSSQPLLEAALRLAPGNQQALWGLGLYRLAEGDLNGAVAYLQEAVEAQNSPATRRYPLGLAYLYRGDLAGVELVDEVPGSYAGGAWQPAGRLAVISPRGYERDLLVSSAAEKAGAFDQAVERYRLALAAMPAGERPAHLETYSLLAAGYYLRLGGASAEPQRSGAYFSAAEHFLRGQERDRAQAALDLVSIDDLLSGRAEYWSLRGRVAEAQLQAENAARFYREALGLDSDALEALAGLERVSPGGQAGQEWVDGAGYRFPLPALPIEGQTLVGYDFNDQQLDGSLWTRFRLAGIVGPGGLPALDGLRVGKQQWLYTADVCNLAPNSGFAWGGEARAGLPPGYDDILYGGDPSRVAVIETLADGRYLSLAASDVDGPTAIRSMRFPVLPGHYYLVAASFRTTGDVNAAFGLEFLDQVRGTGTILRATDGDRSPDWRRISAIIQSTQQAGLARLMLEIRAGTGRADFDALIVIDLTSLLVAGECAARAGSLPPG